MSEMVKKWNSEKEIHSEIVDYKKELNETLQESEKFDLEFHKDYLDFLAQASASVEKLQQKLIEKNKNNQ